MGLAYKTPELIKIYSGLLSGTGMRNLVAVFPKGCAPLPAALLSAQALPTVRTPRFVLPQLLHRHMAFLKLSGDKAGCHALGPSSRAAATLPYGAWTEPALCGAHKGMLFSRPHR